MRLDENSCSTQIIPPSFLAPRRPPLLTTVLTAIQLSSPSLSIEQSKEENSRSIHLIILVKLQLIVFFKINFI
jgi:hypothetical protein